MPLSAIIFDLDETLLDTSDLRAARDGRDWRAVKGLLHRARPYSVQGEIVHELPARLRSAGLRLGLVTHSPGWYVDELLDRFRMKFDAVITGSDGYLPKPDPKSIQALVGELGVNASDCAYVGDLGTDIAAATGAGVMSIGACWSKQAPDDWRRWWPDVALARPSYLEDLEGLESRRPLAEVVLGGGVPSWHWGTVMRLERTCFALGRYFTPEDVERHPHHPLSRLVLEAKDVPAAAKRAGAVFAELAAHPSWRVSGPEIVTSVPPRPDQTYDRFGSVRAAVAESLDCHDEELLGMEFAVDDYKAMDHSSRRAANEGRFRPKRRLNGERILLIDDVVTSGSQGASCQAALMIAGAGSVEIASLSAAQDRLPEACPRCGSNLRIRTNSHTGEQFIGCSGFTRYDCRYTRSL